MQARTMTARGGPKVSRLQQCFEGAVDRRIRQRPAMTAYEHMVIAGTELAAAYQVVP
jgi:hypothetical protein